MRISDWSSDVCSSDLVLTAALLLAACGSQSEKEVASGTVTDPETGETTDYQVTASGEGDEGNVSIKTEDGEMSFGGGAANAKLPDGFAPSPGSKMTGGFTATGKGRARTGYGRGTRGAIAINIA